MPDGAHPNFVDLPFFKNQREEKENLMHEMLTKEKMNNIKNQVQKGVE